MANGRKVRFCYRSIGFVSVPMISDVSITTALSPLSSRTTFVRSSSITKGNDSHLRSAAHLRCLGRLLAESECLFHRPFDYDVALTERRVIDKLLGKLLSDVLR